ncbi:MAG TPA: transposase [Methylocella sp.]|nr:transposase [Methylocella sp.]
MLSAIVFCEDQPGGFAARDPTELLARTLASLVPAAVEGLLTDVWIAGAGGQSLAVLANGAGCAFAEAEDEAGWIGSAARTARGPDIFLLRCGRAPQPDFIEEAKDFLISSRTNGHCAAFLRTEPENLFERVVPRFAEVAGVIAPRSAVLAAAGGFQKIVRFLGPSVTLQTRARRVVTAG